MPTSANDPPRFTIRGDASNSTFATDVTALADRLGHRRHGCYIVDNGDHRYTLVCVTCRSPIAQLDVGRDR